MLSPYMQTPLDPSNHWAHLGTRTKTLIAFHVVAVITGGLVLDIALGWTGQHLATAWTFAVWGWLFWRGTMELRRLLVCCTAIAGAGELVLSLVWGLYDYQFGNIPLFVPPGHALLMTLGLIISANVSARLAWSIAIVMACWALFAWLLGADRFGVALFSVFAVCMCFGRAKPLYATMFLLALAMELFGTALGNWTWRAFAPGTLLTSGNPPFSAGAFYCLLDLLVLAAVRATWRNAGDENTRPSPSTAK
jgi:hypothetical protein